MIMDVLYSLVEYRLDVGEYPLHGPKWREYRRLLAQLSEDERAILAKVGSMLVQDCEPL
jgi:hypothetical protein